MAKTLFVACSGHAPVDGVLRACVGLDGEGAGAAMGEEAGSEAEGVEMARYFCSVLGLFEELELRQACIGNPRRPPLILARSPFPSPVDFPRRFACPATPDPCLRRSAPFLATKRRSARAASEDRSSWIARGDDIPEPEA